MHATTDKLDLASLNQMFESSDPLKIVEWSAAQFGDGLVMSSSFGAESAVLLHMAHVVQPSMRIIFVNTGYLFPETHAFMEELRQRLNLNVWTYRTRNDPIAYLQKAGEDNPSERKDTDACCGVNKNEPFDRAMTELAPRGWLRGIRRSQNPDRRESKFIEWSSPV